MVSPSAWSERNRICPCLYTCTGWWHRQIREPPVKGKHTSQFNPAITKWLGDIKGQLDWFLVFSTTKHPWDLDKQRQSPCPRNEAQDWLTPRPPVIRPRWPFFAGVWKCLWSRTLEAYRSALLARGHRTPMVTFSLHDGQRTQSSSGSHGAWSKQGNGPLSSRSTGWCSPHCESLRVGRKPSFSTWDH